MSINILDNSHKTESTFDTLVIEDKEKLEYALFIT